MKKVLILDANQRSALAVTRSLGRQGVPLITADTTSEALAGNSRYPQAYRQYGSPTESPADFIDSIATICTEQKIDILLPMTELTTQLLLEHKERLSGVLLPFAAATTVNSVADKYNLMQLATGLDVVIPRTWYIDDPRNLSLDLDSLPYPLVMKPGRSWQPAPSGWFRSSVRIAASADEVRHYLETDPGFQYERFLFQECVTGTGQGIFALYDHGKPLAFFSHRRLREKPPWGGVSVLSESCPLDEKLLAAARSLLDEVKWHGVAMVEFKVGNDGTPYLMEINTRFWGSLQLAIDSGVDFPYLLYQLLDGAHPQPQMNYRLGRRLRWLLGDLDSLYISFKDRRTGWPVKLKQLTTFLTPSFFTTRHEVNRWDDLGPFWYELKKYLRDLRN